MTLDEAAVEAFELLAREQGFKALENQIVFRDLCSGCGTCSAVCPRNCIEFGPDGRPAMKGNAKCINCGLCAIHCPRSFIDADRIEAQLFSGERDELGYHIQRVSARATDEEMRKRAQDGGVVSAMLKYLFETASIDGAALCKADERFVGSPFLAKTWEEARPTSRSKYNLSPNLVALRYARQQKLNKVALVGLPCHIAAFRKLQFGGLKSLAGTVEVAIGLFCSENFCETMVTEFLPAKGVDPRKITKLNIKGRFIVEAGDERVEIPLPEMKEIANPGCLVCRDFTAELSDISVGAIGAPDGWCAVLTRTKKGDDLLKSMVEKGLLETDKLVKPKTLRRMSSSKRIRGNRKLLETMVKEAALPLKMAEIPEVEAQGEEK